MNGINTASLIFRTPIWLWLLPVLVLGSILWARRSSVPRAAVLLRVLIIALVVIGLAEPIKPGTITPAPLLILVDQSDSMSATSRESAWNTATAIVKAREAERTIIAAVGSEVVVTSTEQQPSIETAGTDLTAALQLADGLQPSNVLLLSDGAATTSGVEEAAQALGEKQIPIDVLPLVPDTRMDARIIEITTPGGLRAGQRFRAEVTIESTHEMSAVLSISFNGQLLDQRPIQLTQGRTTVALPGRIAQSGVQHIRAVLDLDKQHDQHAENNVLEKALAVGPTPKVLVVERQPDTAAHLRDMLEAEGVQSEALRPADLSSRLSDLRRFDAIILQDVAANSLSLDQQAALREYVRSLGHGLLTLGGANSYNLGNYEGTPLEEVLPVSMETPPQRERQQIALLLIIDRSASMWGKDPATSKLEMAKSGALAATEILAADDLVGVLTFNTRTEWTVPFTRLGQGLALSEIQDRIAAIQFSGGTDIYNALGTGLQELARQENVVRHTVLLTDGRSRGDQSAYKELLEAARSNGITLSTIAIGDDADAELLQWLADRGGGRYHFAANAAEIPQLTLQETEIARENPRVEGAFQPQPAGAHPVTRGFIPQRFPMLGGYIAVTPKAEADSIIQSPQGDPILAAWQYGLGRAIAWTSDSGERWGRDWNTWDEGAPFWSQALAYLFPDPAQGALAVRIERNAAEPLLIAEARNDDGTPLDLADVGARVHAQDGTETTMQLQQTAPGRYESPLSALDEGAYTIGVTLRKGEQQLETTIGFDQPYPAEFAVSPNTQLLDRLATSTNGRVFESSAEAIDALQSEAAQPEQAYWPWLIGLALALWPLEIAVQQGWLRLSSS
jgi:Ca-activated chloride channel family protein